MNVALQEKQIDCYQKVFTEERRLDLVGETVVSDKLPDIGLLGEVCVDAFLRAKRVDQGVVTAEGELYAFIGYIPDGAHGVCSLEMQIPWQVGFESELIEADGVAVCDVKVLQSEVRMLNPRKVLLKIKLAVTAVCYQKQQITLYEQAVPDDRIQLRTETELCGLTATVCEKNFVATDEYPLSAELTSSRVLSRAVEFSVDDVKTLANKLIIKGTAYTNVILGQENGYTEKINFSTPFSFITETDSETVSSDVKAVILPTAIYLEPNASGQMLNMEAHGVCQIVAYKQENLRWIAGAYSNFYELQISYEPLIVYKGIKFSQMRETASETMKCRGQISKVHFSSASVQDGDQSQQVNVCVSACLQYEGGVQDWIRKTVVIPLHKKENQTLLRARVTDIHTMINGSELDLRVTIEGDICTKTLEQKRIVSEIELNEERPVAQGDVSLTVVRTHGSLWSIAEKYGSTVALICRYNEIEDEDLLEDTLLMIPKQRL